MSSTKYNRWYVWLSIILIFFVLFPYLLGFATQNEEQMFSGSFIGVDDQNSYLAKMRDGYEGNWFYRSPYTNFPQQGIVIYFPFILLGKLAGGENIVGQLQFFMLILRVASIFLYVYALKEFFGHFISDEAQKRTAVALAVFGGGFGFLYFTGLSSLWSGGLPLEFYSPEAFSYLALMTLPHIIIARSFFLLALVTWFKQEDKTIGNIRIRYEIVAIIYGYLIYFFQPITLPILMAIIGIFWIFQMIHKTINEKSVLNLLREDDSKSLILFMLLMIPAIIYNLYMLICDPYVKAWGAQNILTTAPVSDYVLAYGLFIVSAIYLFVKQKGKTNEIKTMGVWITISLIGIYLPISIQRRFIEGSWVFMVLFFILCLNLVNKSFMENIKMRIGIYLLFLSSFFLFSGSVMQVYSKPDRVFIDMEKFQLFNYADQNIMGTEFILANHEIGNEIPLWTRHNTITGMGPESINELFYLDKIDLLMKGQISQAEFNLLLKTNNIHYYVIENMDSVNCNVVYENEEYLLCKAGEVE